MKTYHVYFMSNEAKMLYVGVTNNLQYRVAQHKKKLIPGYTAQYNLFKLVYFEEYCDIREAITREKQIKGWLRSRKVTLVEKTNHGWNDLAADWCRAPQNRCHPEAIQEDSRRTSM
ncbi:MAG: GIY-YIG nuclease family protein [Acidobacteria bacterium]|nr:GIY-YIG nuclease family protein [Acidobacteriota bacterium]MBS1864767.1 GIY-YIG nuclease family protein [Acidobacteriota bacterium]